MTKRQEATVEKIRKYIEERDLYKNSPDYEFKEFSVEETDCGTVIVYSVAGLKGDEGTAASILCRTRRHIFIGKRGGLRCYEWNEAKKDVIIIRGWSDVMIFGYSN